MTRSNIGSKGRGTPYAATRPWALLTVLAVVLTCVVPGVLLPDAARAEPVAGCNAPLLAEQQPANDVEASDPSAFAEAAARGGYSVGEFSALAEDETFWLDQCGQGYYVEGVRPSDPRSADALDAGILAAPLSETFALQSKPGSRRTIYLDFLGGEVSGTAWNELFTYNGVKYPTFVNEPYSLDAQVDTDFSDAELSSIQRVWQSVAEDYAPFDVNVTTKDLGVDAIDRSSSADLDYGIRVMITRTNPYGDTCGCGGVAYVGVFNNASNHLFYNPAWVFTKGSGVSSKGIAEAAAHEAGHTFGLQHHGTSRAGYYNGAQPWAAIMGAGYYQPVTQWSHGEYPDANNSGQDDVAIIATGASIRSDDHGSTAADGTALGAGESLSGIIESRDDVDAFTFTAAGETTVAVSVGSFSDLNTRLTILDSSGTPVAVVDDPVRPGSPATEVALGLGSTWEATLPSTGGTYTALVTGVGTGDPSTAGLFSDYGSLGNYQIALSTSVPLTLTAGDPAAGTVSSAYDSAFVTVAGGAGPYTYAATGLPGGLTMDAATGAVTGTPTEAGTFTVTVTVTDGNGGSDSTTVTLVVAEPVVLSLTTPAAGTVDSPYDDTFVTVSGGVAPFSYAATGLPAGLTIDAATGAVTGTPTARGTHTVTVTVTDAGGRADTQTADLVIATQPLELTLGTPATGTVGADYVSTFVAANGGAGPYTYAAQDLPAGLSIDPSTGAVTGTPSSAGDAGVTITVTDADGKTATKTVTIPIRAALVLTLTEPGAATAGSAYESMFVAVAGGAGPYIFTATGLPEGVSIDSATGAVSGTPVGVGTFDVGITVTDSEGRSDFQPVFIIVSEPLALTAGEPAVGTRGSPYGSTFVAASGGVGPYSFAATGLAPGLSIDEGTGAVGGIPTAAGTFTVTIAVTDADGRTASLTVEIVLRKPLVVTPATPATGTVGSAYDSALVADVTGGLAPYTYSANVLPAGLQLDETTGTLTGTPTEAATSTVKVTVKDAEGRTESVTVTVSVFTPTPPSTVVVHGKGELKSSVGTPGATVGVAFSNTSLSASGGREPYGWSMREGFLPDGLSLHPDTGAITGVPTAEGRSVFTVQATDADGIVGVSEVFSITVVKVSVPIVTPPTTPPGGNTPGGNGPGGNAPGGNAPGGSDAAAVRATGLAATGGAADAGVATLIGAILLLAGAAVIVGRRRIAHRSLT